jgi:hypothetical protein
MLKVKGYRMAKYDIAEEKTYLQPEEMVIQAVKGAIAGLEGEIIEIEEGQKKLKVYFPKTILGNTIGDRTHVFVEWAAVTEGTQVKVLAYPVDAVQRKLQFGARKGVARKVVTWFWAHVEHRLK